MPSLVVDNLDDVTGWIGLPVIAQEYPEYIYANALRDIKSSIALKVENNSGDIAEKIYATPIDLTGYTELKLYTTSLYQGRANYSEPGDFAYKIDFGFGEYYLPARDRIGLQTIALPVGAQLERIRITVMTDRYDVLIINRLLAVNEKLPLDILTDIQQGIQAELAEIEVGQAYGIAGDSDIRIESGDYLIQHGNIRIGGPNPEQHSIEDRFGTGYQLGESGDGPKLLHNHSGDPVYLELPVQLSARTREHKTPSVTIWASNPEMLEISSGVSEYRFDTFSTSGTVAARRLGKNEVIAVQIDCEADQEELLQLLLYAVHRWFKKEIIYGNGVKLSMEEVSAARIDAPQVDVVPKESFVIAIEYEEDIWQRETINWPLTGLQTVTASPVQQVP